MLNQNLQPDRVSQVIPQAPGDDYFRQELETSQTITEAARSVEQWEQHILNQVHVMRRQGKLGFRYGTDSRWLALLIAVSSGIGIGYVIRLIYFYLF